MLKKGEAIFMDNYKLHSSSFNAPDGSIRMSLPLRCFEDRGSTIEEFINNPGNKETPFYQEISRKVVKVFDCIVKTMFSYEGIDDFFVKTYNISDRSEINSKILDFTGHPGINIEEKWLLNTVAAMNKHFSLDNAVPFSDENYAQCLYDNGVVTLEELNRVIEPNDEL
jgi:hypothetical protein